MLSNYPIRVLIYYEKLDGTGENCPLTIYKASICKEVPLKGGLRAHISYKRTPKDQISLLKL
jgi:hypothetical protein